MLHFKLLLLQQQLQQAAFMQQQQQQQMAVQQFQPPPPFACSAQMPPRFNPRPEMMHSSAMGQPGPAPIPMRSFTMHNSGGSNNLQSPQANGRLPPHLAIQDGGIDVNDIKMPVIQSSLPPHLNAAPIRPPHFPDSQSLGQGQGGQGQYRHQGSQPQMR
eukprot:TRINITY_DN6078_c0_g1_i2.p4 TRINITY_DN6078_c0_g1~~TRINITY_DN6078_c0_g1_i2.p4  ORF type:complete len:159 (+),score=22.44 TRINITY_DN6078_c0_g1_i2:965-1441(+)